jgi:putative tricarboxylic transport membrane protein
MPHGLRTLLTMPSLSLALVSFATLPAAAQELTVVAPAAPGGGWDQTARVMQQVLRSTRLATNVQVTNVPGAAGTIGLARFVNADAGNPNSLLVTGLVMVSGIAMNASPVTLADVTPIARLSGEYEVVVVPAASPFTSLAELVAAFRENPRSVSWGGGSAGGTDEILVRLLADAAGVPRSGVNYVAYSGGGQVLAAVLGGHVTAAVSGLGEFAAQLGSGALRAVAISAPERVGVPDAVSPAGAPTAEATLAARIPTLREQGFDVVLLNWRGVVAPPGISRDARQRLESTVEQMTRSGEWRAALTRNGWTDLTLVGEAFGRFLMDETRRVAPLVAGDRGGPRRDGFEILVLSALILSLVVAGAQLVRHRSLAPPGAGTVNRNALLCVVAGVTLEAALLRPAGFVVASAVMFACVARAFGSRRLVRDGAVGLVLAAIVFLAFARGLGVSLPAGPFG